MHKFKLAQDAIFGKLLGSVDLVYDNLGVIADIRCGPLLRNCVDPVRVSQISLKKWHLKNVLFYDVDVALMSTSTSALTPTSTTSRLRNFSNPGSHFLFLRFLNKGLHCIMAGVWTTGENLQADLKKITNSACMDYYCRKGGPRNRGAWVSIGYGYVISFLAGGRCPPDPLDLG